MLKILEEGKRVKCVKMCRTWRCNMKINAIVSRSTLRVLKKYKTKCEVMSRFTMLLIAQVKQSKQIRPLSMFRMGKTVKTDVDAE